MVISMHSKCRGSNTSSAVVFHCQSCLRDLCDEARSLPLSLCLTLSGLMHERDLHVWAATGELPFSTSLYLRFDVSQQDCAVFISPPRSLFSAAATFLPPLPQCLRGARPCSTPLCLFPPRGACAWVQSDITSGFPLLHSSSVILLMRLNYTRNVMTLHYLLYILADISPQWWRKTAF